MTVYSTTLSKMRLKNKCMITAENDITLVVVPVQLQQNGSDCGVFPVAFATCLVLGILPETEQFNVPAMRPHLLRCLKAGKMELFPTL